MPIIDYIEKAQQSSASKRKVILIISTAIIMSIVVAIWFVQFRLPSSSEVAVSNPQDVEDPFTFLGAYLKGFFSNDAGSEGELYIPRP